MFRKSVCECNNYNVRTVSSIPSVGTLRNSAFFLHGYEHQLGLIIASLFDRLDLENVLPQLLHNAHKSGIITGVTPDQQEIQFADYDNQSITTHAVFEDYEVDKNHRHCRPFLLTFSAFKLEVSDLGMNIYIKKDLRCVSNFQVKTTIMHSLTMHTKQRQKLRAVVQVEIALQNAFPMSCFIFPRYSHFVHVGCTRNTFVSDILSRSVTQEERFDEINRIRGILDPLLTANSVLIDEV